MIIWQNALILAEITLGYGLLCVYLPSLCLHGLVREKPLTYRFIFYQVSANLYLILWGFILAFLKCFNAPMLWFALVLLPLAGKICCNLRAAGKRFAEIKETAETIVAGMFGWHALRRSLSAGIRRGLIKIYRRYIKEHIWELLGLCLLFALVLCTFGQYHFTHEGFACEAENVHFYWEKELLHGNPFPAGMAPHGMHFLAAALSSMLGLTLSRVSMMIGLFNTCLLFGTLYLLLKETFSSRTAVLFGIAFFLATNIFTDVVYWRYQAALPMEMGLIPCCMMLYGLQRYVKSRDKRDLCLFILSAAWCIQVDFHAAILAAVCFFAFVISSLVPLIRKKILHWTLLGGLLGILLGGAPFGLGCALGYPFEQSGNWIMEHGAGAWIAGAIRTFSESAALEELWNAAFWTVESFAARAMLLGIDIALLLWGLLGAILSRKNRPRYRSMLFWGLAWLMGVGVSAGVVSRIPQERFAVFFGFLSIPLFAVPAQILYSIAVWIRFWPKVADMGLLAAVLTFFFFMAQDGYVKSEFTVEAGTISEGDMKTCYRLMEEYPDKTWAIVSTTYDSNLVRYHGYHHEIIDILKRLDAGEGSLYLPLNEDQNYVPTKDIFVVVETKIEQYESASSRRNSRSGGNALENYGDPAPELALMELPQGDMVNSAQIYAYPWRGTVMSKLYYWIEKVKAVYPNEVSIFYQDETVSVYHISQDEYFPLDLMLDYQSGLR